MEKTKPVRMPAGIRNKLMAAVAMLLVSSIMMVSSTYAWFTLSTAPEVTGITTSVGANGNLEMALLNTETFDNLAGIQSAVGDSSQIKTAANANITWGNLVDLSEAVYGLQNINLQPARLKFAEGSTTAIASVTGPLATPTYGKDGRVADLSGTTYSTVLDASGAWAFNADTQQYGVRAIGANDNLSPQAAGLMAAKAAYSNNLNSAKSTIQGALSANGNALASALTSLAMDSTAELTTEQQAAVNALINASGTALGYIDSAYKQILLAAAANQLGDAVTYNAAAAAINDAANYSAALAALTGLSGTNVQEPDYLDDAVSELATQQQNVADARTAYDQGTAEGYKTALSKLVETSAVTINGYDSDEIIIDGAVNSDFTSAVINDGGAIVAMPDDSGVFAYIGSVAGNYQANCKVDISYGSTQLTNLNATMKTTATVDPTIGTGLNQLQPAASTGSAATVLSDTYGYALDFAFRTNAAESSLQLQTEGAQRVYGDSSSAATQGGGATMTFQTTTTSAGAPTLTDTQVKNLMGAIRVAFVNPVGGTVHGIAALKDIEMGADGFTGDLYLMEYTVNASGALELGAQKTDSKIVKLNQSEATRLTVIVWLDGDLVDNSDVANAAQSLVGSMNLQFSSSAELVPMSNTALHNMTITYTELTSEEYKAGVYTFNNALYTVNGGYKIYQGSDNTVYFSNDEATYTKLTVLNQNTVLTPVTVSVSGNGAVEVGATTAMNVGSTAGTVKTVVWSVAADDAEVASVTGDASGATVNGLAAGSAKITAAVELEFANADASATTVKNVNVDFTVTVTEPAPANP